MHNIEPFFKWREEYAAEDDERSPFYGRVYDEFGFSNKIYNYYIHPQWDDFGSQTLYLKILFTDYLNRFTIIELLGEWNDALYNDIMYLKRNIGDHLSREGIHKYILISDNVLNYHGDDDSYYEEWFEDNRDNDGWIVNINVLQHVKDEMINHNLDYYIEMSDDLNEINWRTMKPEFLYKIINQYMLEKIKNLR